MIVSPSRFQPNGSFPVSMFVCDNEPTPSSLESGDTVAQLAYTCEKN